MFAYKVVIPKFVTKLLEIFSFLYELYFENMSQNKNNKPTGLLLEKINKQEMKRADIADKQVKAAEKKLSKKTKGKKNEGHTYETWNFRGVDLSDADSVERERSKLESATKNIKTKYFFAERNIA